VVYAIEEVAKRIIGMDVEAMFADMGAFWEFRTYSTLSVVSIPNVQSYPTPSTDG
jgi:hypothetical protein